MHFEFTCNRSGLFNEHYLSAAVGQILSATYGDRVHGEFDHPILAPLMTGRGRRPALDFVYCDPYPTIKVAVETKWAGSAHTTAESIIWDLIRLELVAHHHGAECIFLLAGQRSDLTRLFRTKDFFGPAHTPGRTPILNTNSNSLSSLSLLPDKHYRIPLLRTVFERCQDVPVPHSVVTRRSQPFPIDCPNNQFQVFAWHIKSAVHRNEFVPANNKHFKTTPTVA
jgi:hypothetical protein